MLAKKIKYTDYNGVEREEVFHFHLNKAELTEMELSTKGGMSTMLQDIVSADNTKKIVDVFKNMILSAYGEKSEDGKRFIKSEDLATAFSQTEAYSELFIELATDTKSAINFVNGVMPVDMEQVTEKDIEHLKIKDASNADLTIVKKDD